MTFKTAIFVALAISFATAFFWVAHAFFLGLLGNLAQVAFLVYIVKVGIKSPVKQSKPAIDTNVVDP